MLRMKVSGMTCQHCVLAIRRAVGTVAPHANVAVDLDTGMVDITGPVDAALVLGAIQGEGYQASVA